MLPRAFAIAIVIFWLVMTSLLIRNECFPESGRAAPVPVDYVRRVFFRHEQSSDLALFQGARRLDGEFHLQPKPAHPGDGERLAGDAKVLNASGNFLLVLPGIPSRRIVFFSLLEWDEHENLRSMELTVSAHESVQQKNGVSLRLQGNFLTNQWNYRWQETPGGVREGAGTPAELLAALDLDAYGIDPHTLALAAGAQGAPAIRAHRGTLRANSEDVEALVVTFAQGDTVQATVYINPLGQILAVKTFLGYDLYDESFAP